MRNYTPGRLYKCCGKGARKGIMRRGLPTTKMGEQMTSWFPGGSGLTASDFAVFLALLGAMTALGWRIGRRTETPDEFFRGGRRVPWLAAALALVAAEVSALTIIGVPTTAFRGDWTFLQFFLGAAAARVLVAFVFVPAFFRGGGDTAYAYLGQRFGPWTRTAAAGSFVASRLLIAGVRLLAASVAAGALLGWGPLPTLALFTLVALAALARGGAPAAVWTGAFQALVMLGAGAVGALYLLHRAEGGLPAVLNLAAAAGKFRVLDWGPSPLAPGFLERFFSEPAVFLVAVLTGFFGSAAAFGTDHELAQKYLVVKDAREGRNTLLASTAGSLLVLLVYLLIGTLLFVFYKQNPGMALPEQLDRIFPHFASTAMPRVLRGLVLSAIVMASIDAPLASLSAAFMTDIRRPFARALPPGEELRLAQRCAAGFALVLAALAALFILSDSALSLAFKAGGVTSGPLLGVFLLGLSTERRGDLPVVSAFGAMAALDFVLLLLSERGLLPVGWGWLVVLGTCGTYALAYAFTRPAAAPRSAE
jgi:solute:Na+ symporter, SSS family